MIIYIHGFGGSGEGYKAKAFRNYFQSHNISFLAPSLSYIPELAINTLEELIANFKDVKFIGSSLGGYYALYLARKFCTKAIVINPALYPYERLKSALGYACNFYDESHFEWKKEHLEMLKLFDCHQVSNQTLFLLQKGDELLDYQDVYKKFQNPQVFLEEGGNHSYEGIESKFELIKSFLLD